MLFRVLVAGWNCMGICVTCFEWETDRHRSPEDMTLLGPIVARLLASQCTWWTIGLNDCGEALATGLKTIGPSPS